MPYYAAKEVNKLSQAVYSLGIDVGSTTVKTVVTDENKAILSHCYQRHLSRVRETVEEQLTALQQKFPDAQFRICITGNGLLDSMLSCRMCCSFLR